MDTGDKVLTNGRALGPRAAYGADRAELQTELVARGLTPEDATLAVAVAMMTARENEKKGADDG